MSIQTPAPRSSAFTAAVLSMLIPGLGQAYQRRWHAALLFVSPLFLITALVAGIYVADGLGGLAGALISDRKSTRLNSSHVSESRMPSSA